MAVRHAGDSIPRTSRFVLSLLGGIRRWTFLPGLCATAPVLVLYKGGDALSVCFNTVAVLFLCEVDNLAYAIGLNEKVRAQLEVKGRIELSEVEADSLARSKLVHMCVLGVAIPYAVWVGGESQLEVGIIFLALYLAGVVEAVVDVDGVVNACKKVGILTGRWLLGLVGYFVLAGTSYF
jgi:hypothetical protein